MTNINKIIVSDYRATVISVKTFVKSYMVPTIETISESVYFANSVSYPKQSII